MNSLRNLPIILRYEDDGTVVAQCPLLPSCQCTSTSRFDAIRTMQQMVKHAIQAEPLKKQKYEVIHLAVASASDSIGPARKRLPRQPRKESPLIEVR